LTAAGTKTEILKVKDRNTDSRFAQHLQWVQPVRTKKKKDFYAFKSIPARKGKPDKRKALHNPPLCAHDEAIFLLHIASEVEHALMVQYLYAAFSLGGTHVPEDKKELVNDWRKKILAIAREEMGHLITVQNILHSIGGPLTFQREDFPFDSQLYPFPFTLERLTKKSLAKYVIAEMPSEEFLKKHRKDLLKEIRPIKKLAQEGADGKNVNRVGMIYEKVQQLLDSVETADFLEDSNKFQSPYSAWGTNDSSIIIMTATNRKDAKAALAKVSEQGEGEELHTGKKHELSHFERFLEIYQAFPDSRSWQPSKKVPVNPSTNIADEKNPPPNAITNIQSLLWAQLSNQRYRMILLYLSHCLQIEIKPKSFYGQLVSWTFGEMYNLRAISDILTTLPQVKGGPKDQCAASPFEIPYNLHLPSREGNKWRTHRDQLLNSQIIIDQLLGYTDVGHTIYLKALRSSDEKALAFVNAIINA
jgi:rubrerythrin